MYLIKAESYKIFKHALQLFYVDSCTIYNSVVVVEIIATLSFCGLLLRSGLHVPETSLFATLFTFT